MVNEQLLGIIVNQFNSQKGDSSKSIIEDPKLLKNQSATSETLSLHMLILSLGVNLRSFSKIRVCNTYLRSLVAPEGPADFS